MITSKLYKIIIDIQCTECVVKEMSDISFKVFNVGNLTAFQENYSFSYGSKINKIYCTTFSK